MQIESYILKALIVNSGLNQRQFCEKHNLVPQRISEWLKSNKTIRRPLLVRIAKQEGVKIQWEFKLIKLL
jgi:transcriptional regulator with XRE-family HTH domain